MKYRINSHEHIFESEKHFDQCHASTIEILPNGDVVAAWFAGSHEKASDVAVWMSKKTKGAWSLPRIIADKENTPCWNPVLFYHESKLALYYKVGNEINSWRTMVKESYDNGESWTDEKELVHGDIGGRGPVKNKCICLSNGSYVAPASIEDENGWDCFVDISYDKGSTWERSGFIPRDRDSFSGMGIIQPALWEDNGILYLLARSTEGAIYFSRSNDSGKTWSKARRTNLPNNNCGLDIAKLSDGRLVLVFNPVQGNWAARSPIAFSVSEDNGATWSKPQILDHAPSDTNIEDAEFSYPAIVARENQVFITYTWKRRAIAYWNISFPTEANAKDAISNGVWATMITPFKADLAVDYEALGRLVDWYINRGVDGLFAVCQSSEMFFLDLEERVEIARYVVERADKRVPVIASGHISDDIDGQIAELREIGKTGVNAVVIVSNRLAKENEKDDVWKRNAQRIMEEIPDCKFGIYECPYPYKRQVSPELLKWCANTGRFTFLKDTSCNLDKMLGKLKAVEGTGLKIFNANTATLVDSLHAGVHGFCGVMANFHPELYAWLFKNWSGNRQKAQIVQSFATVASMIELQNYPGNAKYHLSKCGVQMESAVRKPDAGEWTSLREIEIDALYDSWRQFKRIILNETTPLFSK